MLIDVKSCVRNMNRAFAKSIHPNIVLRKIISLDMVHTHYVRGGKVLGYTFGEWCDKFSDNNYVIE